MVHYEVYSGGWAEEAGPAGESYILQSFLPCGTETKCQQSRQKEEGTLVMFHVIHID